MQLQDINELTEEEKTMLYSYAMDKSNLLDRYIIACQIITNLLLETLEDDESIVESFQDDFEDSIDLTICKMLLDGEVSVEQEERKIH
tara:strand:- start:152 stop:415 length:264 start_codon:yes stop_codon:yes gene_type:complete